MDSGLNYSGNCAVFSGINSDMCRLSNHTFFVFLFAFLWNHTFYKSNILVVNNAYIKGINKGGVAGRYPEGKIARGNISHSQASYR